MDVSWTAKFVPNKEDGLLVTDVGVGFLLVAPNGQEVFVTDETLLALVNKRKATNE
jgi:hypothetical protein